MHATPDRRLGLDDWWKAVRSGAPAKVAYLLSRRGASVLSQAERPGRLAAITGRASLAASVRAEKQKIAGTVAAQGQLPGAFPRVLKRRAKDLTSIGSHAGWVNSPGPPRNSGGVAPYMWLPGGINARKPRTGQTAAHICAERGYDKILSLLINEGIDLRAKTTNGDSTPLHLAARANQAACADLILLHLDDPTRDATAVNRGGDTVLGVAARFGSADVIAVLHHRWSAPLLSLINALNASGETPLELATRGGHAEAVRCLLEIGAMTSIDGSHRTTTPQPLRRRSPLTWAVRGKNPKVVDVLLEAGAKVEASHLYAAAAAHTRSPSIRDAILPRLQASNALLTLGFDGDRPAHEPGANEMQNAVELAIRNNRGDVAFALLAELEKSTPDQVMHVVGRRLPCGNTLLALASRFGHTSVVSQLIRMGAAVDQRSVCSGSSSDGNTPLCESANDSIVEMLLAAGADPNVENSDSRATPLHFAARRGDARMMERLLNAGASINARTDDGFSPLVEAVRCAPLQRDNIKEEIDAVASKVVFEQHILAANLLAARSEFTRERSDKLTEICRGKDATIAALRTALEDARADAERARLFCLQRENCVRTASRAVLCVFQSIFTQKGLVKGSHAVSAIQDYQEMCRNLGLDVDARKEEDVEEEVQGASAEKGNAREEEGDVAKHAKQVVDSWQDTLFERGVMPELTQRALAVDEWLPVTNLKKKPKQKSKAKLRKEREEKAMEAVSIVADRLTKMLEAGSLLE
jgi:ankyrin repeat protein